MRIYFNRSYNMKLLRWTPYKFMDDAVVACYNALFVIQKQSKVVAATLKEGSA